MNNTRRLFDHLLGALNVQASTKNKEDIRITVQEVVGLDIRDFIRPEVKFVVEYDIKSQSARVQHMLSTCHTGPRLT